MNERGYVSTLFLLFVIAVVFATIFYFGINGSGAASSDPGVRAHADVQQVVGGTDRLMQKRDAQINSELNE